MTSVTEYFRVIVFGGRKFYDRNFIYSWLGLLFEPSYGGESEDAQPWWLPRPDLELILGGATGADQIAEDWAVVRWVKHRVFPILPADWDKYGRGAGPIRNQQMLEEGRPHMGLSFPGGNGTADMTSRLMKAGIPVLAIQAGAIVPTVRKRLMDGRTHHAGCWKLRGHHDCAIAEVQRLTQD